MKVIQTLKGTLLRLVKIMTDGGYCGLSLGLNDAEDVSKDSEYNIDTNQIMGQLDMIKLMLNRIK